MNAARIEKLVRPFRRGKPSSENDYLLLRNAESAFLVVGFMMVYLAGSYLRTSNFLPPWATISAAILTAGFGVLCVVNAIRYRIACSRFERYLPKTVVELTALDSETDGKSRV